MFVSIILLTIEAKPLENTLGGLRLFLATMFSGITVGFAIAYFVLRRRSSVPLAHAEFYIVCLWTGAFLTPALAGLLNRCFSGSEPYERAFIVIDKTKSISKGNTYYRLHIQNGAANERIEVSANTFQSVQKGAKARFTLRSGFLGFPIIDNIR